MYDPVSKYVGLLKATAAKHKYILRLEDASEYGDCHVRLVFTDGRTLRVRAQPKPDHLDEPLFELEAHSDQRTEYEKAFRHKGKNTHFMRDVTLGFVAYTLEEWGREINK